MEELPFRVVYCSSESAAHAARGLERHKMGVWISDARHRYPLELGLWVGDCTLEAVQIVAHEALVPRRVGVFTAVRTGLEIPREPPSEARKGWRAAYATAVFTQLGVVEFDGISSAGMREAKLSRPATPVLRCEFVRLVLDEPLKALGVGQPGEGGVELARASDARRQHCVGLARLGLYGTLLGGGARPTRHLKLDASEKALAASGVPENVVADLARRRVEREERRDDETANLGGDDLGAAFAVDPLYARGVVFCHSWQPGDEDESDSLVGRYPPLDVVRRAAAREASEAISLENSGDDDDEGHTPDDDDDCGEDDVGPEQRRPLAASDEPLQLFPEGQAPAIELARLLDESNHESVSVRLVRWMNAEGVADLASVAQALGQMRAVTVSVAPRTEETDEDPVLLPTSYESASVANALSAALGPLALAFLCQGNTSMRKQVLELARDGASKVDAPALAAAADRAARTAHGGDAIFPHAAERQRRLLFAAVCTLVEHGLTDPSVLVFSSASRLLVDVFDARRGLQEDDDAGIRFIDAAARSTFDASRSAPDDDLLQLRPWQLLRKGIRPNETQVPLREALEALRSLIPSVARRLSFPGSGRRAAWALTRLARVAWLGPPLVAAACLPRIPQLARRILFSFEDADLVRLVAESTVYSDDVIEYRLFALTLLVARCGAVADSVLSARDLLALATAAINLDRRRGVVAAATRLLAAVYRTNPNVVDDHPPSSDALRVVARAVDVETASRGPSEADKRWRAADAALRVAETASAITTAAARDASAASQTAAQRAEEDRAQARYVALVRVAWARKIGRAWRLALQRLRRRKLLDSALVVAAAASTAAATCSTRATDAAAGARRAAAEEPEEDDEERPLFDDDDDNDDRVDDVEAAMLGGRTKTPPQFADDDDTESRRRRRRRRRRRETNLVSSESATTPKASDGKVHPEPCSSEAPPPPPPPPPPQSAASAAKRDGCCVQ